MSPAKPPVRSTAEVASQAKDYMAELKDVTVKLAKLQQRVDEKILPIQSKFNEDAAPLKARLSALELSLEKLASEYRDQLFSDDEKKVITPFGAYGFRATPEAVLLDDEEHVVIAAVRKSLAKFADTLVRVKESLDKVTLKKLAKDGDLEERDLEKIHVRIEPGEKFAYAIDKQKL